MSAGDQDTFTVDHGSKNTTTPRTNQGKSKFKISMPSFGGGGGGKGFRGKKKNMPISEPRNFRQLTHIGYNKDTGEFEGLPPEWAIMLSCSSLSEEEKAQHPEFVLKVLDFQQKQINKDVGSDSDLSDDDSEYDSDEEEPPAVPSRPPPTVKGAPPKPGASGAAPRKTAPQQAAASSGAPPKPVSAGPALDKQTPEGEVTLKDLINSEDPRKLYTDFQEIGKG